MQGHLLVGRSPLFYVLVLFLPPSPILSYSLSPFLQIYTFHIVLVISIYLLGERREGSRIEKLKEIKLANTKP